MNDCKIIIKYFCKIEPLISITLCKLTHENIQPITLRNADVQQWVSNCFHFQWFKKIIISHKTANLIEWRKSNYKSLQCPPPDPTFGTTDAQYSALTQSGRGCWWNVNTLSSNHVLHTVLQSCLHQMFSFFLFCLAVKLSWRHFNGAVCCVECESAIICFLSVKHNYCVISVLD